MLSVVITPPVPPQQYVTQARRTPVPTWRRVRRYAVRGIACCAVWPLGLTLADLASAEARQSPALTLITAGFAAFSVACFAAFFGAKAALWWHGES
jgi:hypothetical protein